MCTKILTGIDKKTMRRPATSTVFGNSNGPTSATSFSPAYADLQQPSILARIAKGKICQLLLSFIKNRVNVFILFGVVFATLFGIFVGSALFGGTSNDKLEVRVAQEANVITQAVHQKFAQPMHGDLQVNVPFIVDEYLSMFNETMIEEEWLKSYALYERTLLKNSSCVIIIIILNFT